MLKFNLGSIPVQVQWWFWLLVAFLGGATRATNAGQWQMVLVFMLAAFISILVHELGHAVVGLRLGAPQTAITLHGLGGFAVFPGAQFSRKQRILMTAAGPAAGFLLAAAAWGALQVLDSEHFRHTGLFLFTSTLFVINVFWSIFNLFPILPLDGGRIVGDVLGPKRVKATCIISFFTLILGGILLWNLTQSAFNLILIGLFAMHTFQVWQTADSDKPPGM